jgi:hypothetical protein
MAFLASAATQHSGRNDSCTTNGFFKLISVATLILLLKLQQHCAEKLLIFLHAAGSQICTVLTTSFYDIEKDDSLIHLKLL